MHDPNKTLGRTKISHAVFSDYFEKWLQSQQAVIAKSVFDVQLNG